MEKHKVGTKNDEGKVWICTPFITRNGVKIYPKNSKVFCFWATPRKDL